MRSITLGMLIALVMACGGSTRQFEGRLARLETQVRDLEQSVNSIRQSQALGDGDTRQQHAELQMALATVDEMGLRVQAMSQDLEQRQRDVAVMLDDLTDRVLALESAAVAPEGERPQVEAPAKELFDRARTDLDAGRADLAAMGFRSFIERFPGSPLAADAQFMIGESFYVRDQHEQARAEYQKVLDSYPSSAKRPLAMLRAGICLANMGRSDQAAAMLRRVIETYPGTNEALAARERLADFQ